MNRETEIDLNQFVPKVQFELIPIKNLVSNQDYQRNLSIKHVQKVASHFDLQQINPVKVSRRNGINYPAPEKHLSGAWSMMILFTKRKQISLQTSLNTRNRYPPMKSSWQT